MTMENSIGIARALIKRYGLEAQAIAEERASIMAQDDPGIRHVWEQVPSVVCELRRSGNAQARREGKAAGQGPLRAR
ncbi:MAG: hypothetical protein HIU92_18505 [Proteobacteria bacterium]|nr:hypothetical protein [Pseudomonadota bacterium]